MNVAEERTKSFWMDTEVAAAPPLDGDRTADVVVIGSGIAGLSTAYELTARGRSVIVLDRGRIGSGMTARTTAHLASALDDRYAALSSARGIDAARVVYESQAAAINRIESIQASEAILSVGSAAPGRSFEVMAGRTGTLLFDRYLPRA
jgi:glycine/D-amino acid oxidase-like deaminating enzyme